MNKEKKKLGRPPKPKGDVVPFHTRNMPRTLRNRIKVAAFSTGKTMEDIVNELLDEALIKRGQ